MLSGSTVTFSVYWEKFKNEPYFQKKKQLNSFPSLNSHLLIFTAYLREKVSMSTHPAPSNKKLVMKAIRRYYSSQAPQLLLPLLTLHGPGTFPPWGLGTGCSPCLEHVHSDICTAIFLTSKSLLKSLVWTW